MFTRDNHLQNIWLIDKHIHLKSDAILLHHLCICIWMRYWMRCSGLIHICAFLRLFMWRNSQFDWFLVIFVLIPTILKYLAGFRKGFYSDWFSMLDEEACRIEDCQTFHFNDPQNYTRFHAWMFWGYMWLRVSKWYFAVKFLGQWNWRCYISWFQVLVNYTFKII